jgi:hypothetical protein
VDTDPSGRERRAGREPHCGAAVVTDLHDVAERRRAEALVGEVLGVVASRIVPGFDRPVDEVHVVATTDRSAKQIVRDVQSLLYAQMAISIDHRVVSVVQIDAGEDLAAAQPEEQDEPSWETEPGPVVHEVQPPPEPEDPGVPASDRAGIVRVASTQDGLDVRVTVSLTHGSRDFEGTATGTGSATGRRRAVARATLAAIQPMLPDSEAGELEGVTVKEILGHPLAVALVQFHGPSGSRTVSGTAQVREADPAAVARSVLDAVNRFLRPDPTYG